MPKSPELNDILAKTPEAYKILYNYVHVPTIRRFALDEHRIRGIMGPFGSGKSSGCVHEIIRRAHEQKPGPDGIRRTRFAVVRNCYDDQTEILTEKRGWQLFKDLLEDDKVASLVNDQLIYQLPDGVVSFPYQGEMLGFEGEGVNFLVTPDHKMYVSKRHTRKKIWGDYEIFTAQEIYNNQCVRVKRDAQWTGTPTDLSCDVYEWLGFWFAEGSYGIYPGSGGERITITQCNIVGIQYMRDLTKRAGLICFEWKRSDTGINFILNTVSYIEEKQHQLTLKIISLVKNAGKARDKKIPLEILSSPTKHLQAFLRGFMMGDGSTWGGMRRMQISSKQLADDLQEVALKSGNVANVYMSCDNTGRPILDKDGIKKGQTNGPTYCITLLQPRKYQPILYVNLKTTNHLRGWYKEQYDGNVYCVEMPLVPVYVRRKGKAFWCMRTYKQLQDTTIRTFFDWYPPRHFGEYNKTDHNYIINAFKDIEVEIMFRALDRPDHVKNLLSLEITGCWINEAREIQQLIFWALDGRIGRYPAVRDGGCTWRGIIMDTNPPDEESWWYDLFEVKRPDNAKVFKQPSGLSSKAENLANLDQGRGYYENMAKGKDEMYVKVYVHGQYGYVLEGKPVFGSYRDNVHCANQILTPIRGLDLIVGMDFALQPTMVIGQIHPRGQLRTIDELLSDGMGLKQFCNNILLPHLRVNYHGFKIMGFGDPSGSSRAPTDESTCFDILHSPEIGLNYIIPAPTNALVPRIGAVEAFLNKMVDGEPGFLLSPKCSKLRKAMAGAYHYPEIKKQHGQFKEKPDPVKNDYSHVADALQEMCMYVDTKAADDLRNKAFLAQMQGRMGKHNVADKLSGY